MSKQINIVKYLPNDWFNTKDKSLLYGIDIKTDTGEILHASEYGKPLLYASKNERNKHVKQLNKSLTSHP